MSDLWLLASGFLQDGDPVPFGPSSWTWKQWIGISVYVAVFLIFVLLIGRLARPEVDSESSDPAKE